MDIKIRSARGDDAAFLAWLILTAGRAEGKRGIWEVVLNEPEDKCLSFLEVLSVTQRPHLFHHSCYLVAEVEGRPVAGLGGYDPDVLGYPSLRKALPEAFGKVQMHPTDEMKGSGSPGILECIPASFKGAWVIDSVATAEEFRRKGIASSLLETILEKGRRLGFRIAQINIYIGNRAAQEAYEKQGFKIVDEKRDPYFERKIGFPGMARMLCEL